MEQSISPDDRDYANGERPRTASEQPTKIMPPASATAMTPVAAASGHCASCGAALAADQRYCVECGQRRGPLRMPATIGATQQIPPEAKRREPRRRAPRMSPNTTLIAGIGTLMLAMGVGVLIGQAGGSSNDKPVQFVTLPGGGAGTSGAAATESGGSGGSGASESTSASKSASTGSGKAKKSVEQVLKGKHLPPKAVVKVGTPGKGPGYQKGHFTGKFFGGAENAKQEEEEELGEEPSSGKK